MKYTIKPSNRFKRDLKTVLKRGCDRNLLLQIIDILASGAALDEKHRDHALTGSYIGYRECHIQPDWLLVYRFDDDILVLTLIRTGTHSDLF